MDGMDGMQPLQSCAAAAGVYEEGAMTAANCCGGPLADFFELMFGTRLVRECGESSNKK